MRIGMFVSFGIGGADKSSYYLAKGLKEIGHDVVILYTELSFPKVSSQWDENYDMLSRFNNYADFESHLIKNVEEFNNYNLDVLNSHRSGEDLWLIPEFENFSYNFPIVETNFHGELHTKADYRVFPSETLVKFKNIKIPHSVIYNPIMPKLSAGNLRSELGIPEDAFVYGKISRASNDIFTPITYLAYKKNESPNTYFLQMGINNATLEIIEKLKLKNFIAIEQSLDEEKISKFYNSFDLYCHGNKLGETFGNTVAESMMHGKPVVSHIGASYWPQAHCEVIGKYDYIVKNQDINAYSQYSEFMHVLKNNKIKYNEYKLYCENRAMEYFDYKIIAKKYSELFSQIVKEKIFI